MARKAKTPIQVQDKVEEVKPSRPEPGTKEILPNGDVKTFHDHGIVSIDFYGK